jgi:hypothetical protein
MIESCSMGFVALMIESCSMGFVALKCAMLSGKENVNI